MTVLDLWTDAGLLDAARAAHAADLERVGGAAGVPGADPGVVTPGP